jgi:hypothetical protein
LPDFDAVTGLDLDVYDRAIDVARNFDCGFVGLELNDRLILLDGVAGLDQHANDVAFFYVFAQLGQLQFCGHW